MKIPIETHTDEMHEFNKKIYASLGIPSAYEGRIKELFSASLDACAEVEEMFISEYPDGTFQEYVRHLTDIVNEENTGWTHETDRLIRAKSTQKTKAIVRTIDSRNLRPVTL